MSTSFSFPPSQYTAVNAVLLFPFIFTCSPQTFATVQQQSKASCNPAIESLIMLASSAKNRIGTSSPLSISYPLHSCRTARCITVSSSLLRTAPFTQPCPLPISIPNSSVSPHPVSYRPVTLACSACTTLVTPGSTPVHRSHSHCTSRTQDMKNDPRSRYPTHSTCRSRAFCSWTSRMTNDCSGALRPCAYPACDSGTAAFATSSYSLLSMRIISFCP